MNESEKARRRQIGTIGTVARVLIGLLMLSYGLTGGRIEVMHGKVQTGFDPLSVGIGVVAFPALLLAWQWIRAGTCWRPYVATEAARCSPYRIGSCAGTIRSVASCSVRSTTTSVG